MGSLGDHEDKNQPVKRTSTLECSDTETLSLDIQSSPPSIPGTLPFVDTLPLEDAFETQIVNLGDETQILDHPDDVENTGTQLLEDFDNEGVDADGEGTDRTEVLGDTEELSDDDSAKRVGSCLVRPENELYSTILKQDNKGFKAEFDGLINERHSSELDVSTARLPDEGTPKSKLGSAARNFTSVRAAALRASGLAARNMALKVKQCSMQSDNQYPKQHTFEDNVTPVISDSSAFEKEVDGEDFLGKYDEQMNGLKNENKCKVGNSTARRLFMDDSLAEIEGPKSYADDADGGADVHELPACGNEMAGLSYVESQEPGDLSQANALDCVDRFLELNAMDFDKVDVGKSTGGKSKPVSSAKGTQNLAKKNNLRSTAGERGIFDWDDSCEDEGGGEFFTRKKETFFDNGGRRQRSFTQPPKLRLLDSKRSGAAKESKDKEEQLGIYQKVKGLANTDSVLVLPNSKRSDKMAKAIETISKKNLSKEFDEQLKIGSCDEPEATVTHKDMADVLNAGVDTQIAAEAMEALCFGLDVADHDKGDINQGTKNMHECSSRQSKKKRPQSKRDVPPKRSSLSRVCARNSKQTNSVSMKLGKEPNVSSHKQSKDGEWSKRSSLSSSGVCTRSSKQTKSIGANLSKDQIVSLRKQAKDVRKKCDTELVKTQWKKAKSNAEGCFATNSTENIDKVPSEVIEQIEEARAPKRKNIDEVDECHAITSVKKRCLPEQVGTITPIASRTRQRRVANQLRAATVSETDAVGRSVDLGMKRTTRSSVCAGSVFSSSGRQSKGSLFQHNVDKIGPGDADLECNSEVSNVLSKVVVGSLASKHSNRQSDASTRSMGEEGTGRNASLEVSPVGMCKPSGSASTTPVNCTTPISDASPICMGDEYKKQSCRKNLSRSFLVKEINSLISSGPEPTSIIKDSRRRRRDMANVQVLFSHHLDEDIIKQQKKILSRLGASVASSISEATHFVTDKFVRTRNMLEAIASGKPVVTHLWLDSCGQASCFIDERNYILRDAKKEKEFGFSLPVSLAHACQRPLLQGQKVLITRNTKPGKEILVSLVRAVNGLAMERIGRSAFKDDKIPDDLLVLSCEEDYDTCVPFLEKGAAVYSSELLLNGIVTQKLEYGRHRLFEDHVKTTRSTVWLKKQASNQYLPVTKRK